MPGRRLMLTIDQAKVQVNKKRSIMVLAYTPLTAILQASIAQQLLWIGHEPCKFVLTVRATGGGGGRGNFHIQPVGTCLTVGFPFPAKIPEQGLKFRYKIPKLASRRPVIFQSRSNLSCL